MGAALGVKRASSGVGVDFAPYSGNALSSAPLSAGDDLSAICTSLRSDTDAPDVRFDSAGSQTMRHMQLMRSVGADVTNASGDGFLSTTRSGHIPASHMDVLETMSAITPGMQRACWKGVPATVQTFEFEAPIGESNGSAAPLFAGAVAQNISHPHVISTFVHEVNQEEHGERTVYRLRLVQVRACMPCMHICRSQITWIGTTADSHAACSRFFRAQLCFAGPRA